MSKHIEAMDVFRFAEYIMNLKDDEEVCFGIDCDAEDVSNINDENDVECWYFARKMYIGEYGSRFILIDYCGGEEAFAIPFNCYQSEPDGDDKQIVLDHVKRFFRECRSSINKYVYVEVEDTK